MSGNDNPEQSSGIAVIGLAGRFPGAGDYRQYWQNLCAGVESIVELSDEEILASGVAREQLESPSYVKAGAFVDGAELFDAKFFDVTPREAELIDPQQRMFLECAYHALEDAGHSPRDYKGLIGVFAAIGNNNYLFNIVSRPDVVSSAGGFAIIVASGSDYVASRTSFKLDLRGPSINVQTACSSSLVAVHLACESLLNGESDMVLAGGVHHDWTKGYAFNEGGIMSPDGHCRPFDARAGGTVFSNALGVLVLKRLADAVADGDHIRTVILGSACNNDGKDKIGYTAPSIDGQRRVIAEALAVSGIGPETIGYVETHGTGTELGDPIEITALTQAYRRQTEKKGYCAIGSVKANVGHADDAAGICSLIKTVLALEHKKIPPSINFDQPNPQIDFAASPFFVNTELRDWPSDGAPRRAGVSSFGIGGTNAHAILEEAPPAEAPAPARPWQLVVLSARTDTALEAMTDNLAEYLETHSEAQLADVAFTLQAGRQLWEHRRTVLCQDPAEAAAALRSRDPQKTSTARGEPGPRPVVFLFPGQGAQYAGMAAGLYEAEPVFRQEMDRSCEILRPHLGLDLRQVLFPAAEGAEEAQRKLTDTAVTQPALFAVEHALARLWMKWGLRPQAMIGHSIGEYVAACLAGVFSLADALALVAARGQLMQALPRGAMLAVQLPVAEVEATLPGDLSLAAANAPERAVVSGPEEAIRSFAEHLASEGVTARPLHTSHAFHSAMMEPILEPFAARVRQVRLSEPKIPYVSNLTGTWIRPQEAMDPGYWARHLRRTVRFAEGLAELFKDEKRLFLEVGPGRTLGTLARQHRDGSSGRKVLASLRHPKDATADLPFLLQTLGQLWGAGARINWRGFHAGARRRRLPLPPYPFERRHFWIERGDLGKLAAADLLAKKSDLAEWFYAPAWKPSVAPAPYDERAAEGAEPRHWLLFVDACGVGAELAARLRAAGRRVTSVAPAAAGEGFARLGEGDYRLDAAEREGYVRLLRELAEAGPLPDTFVHLWSLTSEPVPAGAAAGSGSGVEEAQRLGFRSLLCLSQALGQHKMPGSVRLTAVANRLLKVAKADVVEPAKATILGPLRVMPKEYPGVRASVIDVELPAGDAERQELLATLLAEASLTEPDADVAYRDGDRWVGHYQPVPIDRAVDDRLRLRRDGVYLVTGGFGGLGMTFARDLARRFQARLVLMGRSPVPPREQWDDHLASHPADPASAKIRQIRELEDAGARVLALAGDVTDPARVKEVVAEARAHFGALHGVVHAAGIAGGGVIQLKTPEAAERVLAPKVRGTLALAAALDGEPVDFFVLCSSTIALLGLFGQVDYCAANCFLDAFAQSRRASGNGTYTVSINWDAWQEVGMAAAAGTAARPGVAAARFGAALEELLARVAEASVAGREVAHPLLDQCLEGPEGRKLYLAELTADRHWIMAEHKVMGTSTMPGTAYLELARAAFEDHAGPGPVEISDVVFITPLMVRAQESRQLCFLLEPRDGGAAFRVVSNGRTSGGEAVWVEHAMGKLGRLADADAAPLPVAEIEARMDRDVEVPSFPAEEEGHVVYWGPRWHCLRAIRAGEGEGLAALELPAAFASDVEDFALHPAMLDVATAALGAMTAPGDMVLPFAYRRLRVYFALPVRFRAYVRMAGAAPADGAGKASRETIAVDVVLFDDRGRRLIEIDHFTLKRAGELAAGTPAAAALAAPESAGAAAPASRQGSLAGGGIRPDEGVEALRRILSRGRLPQVAVSTRDLNLLLERVSAAPEPGATAAGPPMTSHERPHLDTEFVAPRNDLERQLAEIWQEHLGLDEIGVHDNYFDLGGDSMVAIQVIAHCQEAGLAALPEQLFELQTIAELAKAISGEAAEEAEASWLTEPAAEEEAEPDFTDSGLAPQELEKVLAKLDQIG